MFRIVSTVGFLVTFAGIALHHIASTSGLRGQWWSPTDILKRLVYLLTLLFLEQRLSLLGKLRKLIYLLVLLCFLVLAITGFYPALVLGEHVSDYWPMLHVTAGGVFAACLAILALMWANRCRFNENDWPWLRSLIRQQARKKFLPESSELLQKTTFWLLVAVALPLMLSVVLRMFPLIGMAGQRFLANTHRYSALVFALVTIVHAYLIAQVRK